MPWNFKKPEKGVSEVETPWLKLQLDHSTGGITGDVLAGSYAGSRVESLDRDDLMILLGECARDDAQSARLIEAYLDRMWPEWRNLHRAGPGGSPVRWTAPRRYPCSDWTKRRPTRISGAPIAT